LGLACHESRFRSQTDFKNLVSLIIGPVHTS